MLIESEILCRPGRSRKEIYYNRRQRRAGDVIKNVTRLAAEYPEFRRILDAAVEHLTEQTERTPESDRALVMAAIDLGAWTFEEIIDEVHFARSEVQSILDDLLERNLITATQQRESDILGGRPKILYQPK